MRMEDPGLLTIDGLRDFAEEVRTKANRIYIPCGPLGGVYVEIAKEAFLNGVKDCLELMAEPESSVPLFCYVWDENGDYWIDCDVAHPSAAYLFKAFTLTRH
jgi:hypothetical protein